MWLDEIQSQLNSNKHFVVDSPVIDSDCFVDCLRRMCNWASPGPDGVQGFWVKRFPSLHDVILKYFNDMLSDSSTIPCWLPVSRTLISKCQNCNIVKNFWPITYLNLIYKLWTSYLTH